MMKICETWRWFTGSRFYPLTEWFFDHFYGFGIASKGATLLAMIVVWGLLFPVPAAAYIGPRTGLSAIGTLIAFIAAIIVAIFGFLWYPLKRILKRIKQSKSHQTESKEK